MTQAPAATERRVLWAATVRTKPLAERLLAAQAGGFTHITLFPTDVRGWLVEGETLPAMRRMMEAAGVGLLAIDPFGLWINALGFPEDYPATLRDQFDFTADDIFRMAGELGALEINAVEPLRGVWQRAHDDSLLIDSLGQLADAAQAKGHTTTLEFMPISGIADLAHAARLVSAVAHPALGICFDSWHFVRSGSSIDQLARLPGAMITEVQLGDALAVPVGDLINDLLHHRLAPGDGEFPIDQIVKTLRDIGAMRSVGPEVFSDAYDAMPAVTAGERAGAALNRWVAPPA